jgi:hypothetical protein
MRQERSRPRWSRRTVLAAAALLPAFPARSQPAAMHTIHQPYDVETWGEFRKIIMQGDFGAKVHLAEVMAKHPTIGVGAVAEGRGEITIHDGKLIISYGKPDSAAADARLEFAALLQVGTAAAWRRINVDQNVVPSQIESYLAEAAKAHGLDPENSFPFEIEGTLISYLMHVNAAPTSGPHGMGYSIAITVESRGDQLDGRVAGLYVSADLVGIATHGGERTHAHWVSPDGSSTAHLDQWGLRAGSLLLLPKVD